MRPEISIIVPIHNTEPYLRDCLNSIINQTFSNIEVILVNDGSTDQSGLICDEFAKEDKRIKVIHKKYEGVSAARNIGIKTAQGKFIGFVDGDDRIDNKMYEKLYQLCVETDSEIAICALGREVNGKLINERNTGEQFIKVMDNVEALRQMFKGILYRFSLCNKLFKRKCFDNVQFPEGRIHEDLSTTYKLFANAKKSVFTNYIGYIYVKRQESILTSRFSEKRLDAFIGWKEILLFVTSEYPDLIGEVTACFTYSCVDNIYYILNQVEETKERTSYLRVIQKLVRKFYKNIIISKGIAFNYKCLLTLLFCNINFFIISNYIKNNLVSWCPVKT
ncbi:glycosyltransferase [Domibacillus sp. PGB-M46]|uniref:glycosyltransferase family 2 protein n=1 Tax=Domibacillus sp. PGB-M46 TaxID=2910255 RepID=UPI001F56CD74|nr:glycosyltransferase [Domibacillus sp. PGB-M46]MCI2255198.1 glycosyltransferase [Domibacillus sp. PGB-M46]